MSEDPGRYDTTLLGVLQAAGLPAAEAYRCGACRRVHKPWLFKVVTERTEWDGQDGRPGPLSVVCWVCVSVADAKMGDAP